MRWRSAKRLLDLVGATSHDRWAGFYFYTNSGRLQSSLARINTRQKFRWWLLATGEDLRPTDDQQLREIQ